jgi:hypothetical protein
MTLHETVENLKKGGIGSGFGLLGIIIIVIFVRVGILIYNILYPPKIEPAAHAFGKLPQIAFPESVSASNLTYTLNTLSGGLPTDFPDRLGVFPIVNPPPNFLNLDKARTKAATLGFVSKSGLTIPEVSLGNANYEWDELTGLNRKLIFNIVSFDFTLNSNFLTNLTVLNAQHLSDQKSAVDKATQTLADLSIMPNDVDLTKTNAPDPNTKIVTAPQLYSIKNSILTRTTSLSKAQVIRVDLYHKDVSYDLNTGHMGEDDIFQTQKETIPVVYPHPPYSTMTFWIGSGDEEDTSIVQADYTHKAYTIPTDQDVSYQIKTSQNAFDELKSGHAYIASYDGAANGQVLINNVYLAYYMEKEKQDYLMPVIVFEGDKNFFAYVSAVDDEWIK